MLCLLLLRAFSFCLRVSLPELCIVVAESNSPLIHTGLIIGVFVEMEELCKRCGFCFLLRPDRHDATEDSTKFLGMLVYESGLFFHAIQYFDKKLFVDLERLRISALLHSLLGKLVSFLTGDPL